MSYHIRFHPSARREFLALRKELRDRLATRISSLAENPRPTTTAPLKGSLKGLRRLRVGPYRVAYQVDDDARIVTITEVGHRRSIYRRAARRR